MRVAVALLLLGCQADEPWPVADEGWSQVIYGQDDRREFHELGVVGAAISRSVAGQIPTAELVSLPNGRLRVPSPGTMETYYDACPTVRFADQPVPMYCSAFLVGPDTLVTAGHCIDSQSCDGASFVFGYRYDAPGQLRDEVDPDDVYQCAQVLDHADYRWVDHAVVRLDRDVAPHHVPIPVRRNGGAEVGDQVVMAGHPLGLPLKYATDAVVTHDRNSDWFTATLDSFSGNSGSLVANPTALEVEGILVRGSIPDFRRPGTCGVYRNCPPGGCGGWDEEVNRSATFVASVPPLDFSLHVPEEADVTAPFDLSVRGGRSAGRVYVLAGEPGTTPVPGCPGVEADLQGPTVVSQPRLRANGTADGRFTAPASLSGRTLALQAVDLASCEITAARSTTFL
jgi:V8-like Glu-specific endopeptidase